MKNTITLTIDHYNKSRFWAVYAGDELLSVTVYLKGAKNLCEFISKHSDAAVFIVDGWKKAKRSLNAPTDGQYHQLLLPMASTSTLSRATSQPRSDASVVIEYHQLVLPIFSPYELPFSASELKSILQRIGKDKRVTSTCKTKKKRDVDGTPKVRYTRRTLCLPPNKSCACCSES